ncbi:putative F-box protein [Hirschfeldia incana]|nr:putative F-box protein [Hirschfeldia incana]
MEIPEDIVEDILHRIPAEYLVRWKTVSKGWKSLIESGHLAEKHLRRHQKLYGAEEFKITFEGSNSRGFVAEIFTKYEGLRPNNRDSESEALPRVPGSCNGLVCVYDLVYVNLFNPITGVIRKLAPPRGTILSVGFGRDVVTGAYKVVVAYRLDDDRVEIMVFDLSTSKWRRRYKTANPLPNSFILINPKRNPVCVNGSLFWLCSRGHSEILVMSLHTENFRTVSQPKDIDVSSDLIYMWSRQDHLCVSDLRLCRDSDVWVLVQDEDTTKRWERTRFASVDTVFPPYKLHSAWFSPTLVSPYQS